MGVDADVSVDVIRGAANGVGRTSFVMCSILISACLITEGALALPSELSNRGDRSLRNQSAQTYIPPPTISKACR